MNSKENIFIISVVRDFDMYNRLVKDNPFNKRAKLISIDNREENKGIPTRYNEFLDSYNYAKSAWFVFCHEDWEIKENWQKRFTKLDKDALYGPIGVIGSSSFSLKPAIASYGKITNSNKDCTKTLSVGMRVKTGKEVQTFDCQCLIVHSDLIKRHNLRFDEHLSFDLYVEDFCANAKERYDIPSKIMQLKCQHYSFGNVQPRFYKQLTYLQKKYRKAKNRYCSSTLASFGLKKLLPSAYFYHLICEIWRFIFQKKITKSNKLLIKIPVVFWRL